MKHFFTSTTNRFSSYARRGALLLALGAAAPAAWGQSFGQVTSYSTGPNSYPSAVVINDVNADGQPDIVIANTGSNAVSLMLGQGNGFAPISSYTMGTGSTPESVAVGDVNGDGKPDIVAANSGANTIGVLASQGGSSFSAASTYFTGTGSHPLDVALGDVNGDSQLDIVATNSGLDRVFVLLAQRAGGFAAAMTYPTGTGSMPVGLALGDTNGDGRLDIITANSGSNTVGVLLGQANGFAPVVLYSTGAGSVPADVMLGDVNRDGQVDIIAVDYGTSAVGILLGQRGGFLPAIDYSTGTGSAPKNASFGDVNGDGWGDIVASAYGIGQVAVLLGQSSGFSAASFYAGGRGIQFSGVTLADVNGDYRPDIIAANHNSAGTVSVLLNTGTYAPLAARPTIAAPDMALSPNPAHDAFSVTLPAGITATHAELLNAMGQVVRRPAAAGSRFTVETAGLAPGVYALRLTTGAGTVSKRVAVQ